MNTVVSTDGLDISLNNKEQKATINQIDIEKELPVKNARTAINVEDTTTFSDELSKAVECIHFGDTCN